MLNERFHLTPKLIVCIVVGAAALAASCKGVPWVCRGDLLHLVFHIAHTGEIVERIAGTLQLILRRIADHDELSL